MSYTVSILHVPVPTDNAEAFAFLDTLDLENDIALDDPTPPLPPPVAEFARQVLARFPCITEDADGPWADGPLIDNFRSRMTTLGICGSRVGEVLPFLIATAHEFGFVVFDGQDECFHRPGQPPSFLGPLDAPSAPKRPWWRFWA